MDLDSSQGNDFDVILSIILSLSLSVDWFILCSVFFEEIYNCPKNSLCLSSACVFSILLQYHTRTTWKVKNGTLMNYTGQNNYTGIRGINRILPSMLKHLRSSYKQPASLSFIFFFYFYIFLVPVNQVSRETSMTTSIMTSLQSKTICCFFISYFPCAGRFLFCLFFLCFVFYQVRSNRTSLYKRYSSKAINKGAIAGFRKTVRKCCRFRQSACEVRLSLKGCGIKIK